MTSSFAPLIVKKIDIYIALKKEMDNGCTYKKVYVPMTETGFYILLCLRSPNHGYGIVQKVKEITDNEVILGPGTMYGSLSKMEKDGLIQFVCEEDKRKIYQITDLGTEVLELELKRIRRLYRNAQEGWNE
jgi:DNA-binding PadR family transcriptional regulator